MADTSHHLQASDTVEGREVEKVIVLQAEATVDPRETAWRIEFLLHKNCNIFLYFILYRKYIWYYISLLFCYR